MKSRHALFIGGFVVVVSFASLRAIPAQMGPALGDPLAGLPTSVLGAFLQGKERFRAEETPATGLGPVFNGRSCVTCHSVPAVGGSADDLDKRVVRFGRQSLGAPFDPLLILGGPNLQRLSVAAELPGCQTAGEVVPAQANAVGLRQPPPLFGLGLIEAIPEATILANEDAEDANGDGIAGRANINAGVLGRFGWKASVSTILQFVGLALVNELGVTNYVFPHEMSPQGQPVPSECKVTGDPEDADASRLAGHLAFLTFLSPPPRGPITAAVQRGESLFAQIGCASCHVPSLRTGPNSIQALDRKEVPLFSDLLTHYMGVALDDNIPEGAVGGGRWRTPPLWGLRTRKFFLHDGRAADLRTAIASHAGEARQVRDRFLALPRPAQDDLIAFLQSL